MTTVVRNIVSRIVADLSNRSGFDEDWANLSSTQRSGVTALWEKIVREEIKHGKIGES
jgi:hypothetical protein